MARAQSTATPALSRGGSTINQSCLGQHWSWGTRCSTLGWSFCTIPQFHNSSTSRIRRLPSVPASRRQLVWAKPAIFHAAFLALIGRRPSRSSIDVTQPATASASASASNWESRNSHGPLFLSAQPGRFCGLIKVYRSAGVVARPIAAASTTAAACWSNSLHLAHCTPAAQHAHQPRGQRPSRLVRNSELEQPTNPRYNPGKARRILLGPPSGLTRCA